MQYQILSFCSFLALVLKAECQRGQAENHIKSFKTHLAAHHTSCHTSSANQLRLFLHAGAYWMMWHLRPSWRVMQFDTLRLRPGHRRSRG